MSRAVLIAAPLSLGTGRIFAERQGCHRGIDICDSEVRDVSHLTGCELQKRESHGEFNP